MNYRLRRCINTPVLSSFTLLLVLLTVTAFGAFRSQKKTLTQTQIDETQFPVVGEYDVKHRNKEEKAKSELKAKRFRMDVPAVSLPHYRVAAGVHDWPEGFSPLPIADSTLILLGDVSGAEANLSDDRHAVYSDFTIVPFNVLKDVGNVVKENSSVIATRYGGRIKFQDGNSLWVFKSGLGMPRVGRRYLFFLKQSDTDSEIVTAYEIKDGRVFPLDSGTSKFDAYRNVTEAGLIKEVKQKIETLSKTLN
jgi:hypothetical protein